MSHSSVGFGGSGEDYFRGWRALFRLLRLGNSFSGNEKNCAFLNVGERRFANVSSVSGFDFPDDGRGLAITDWDGDGRPDLWVSNRSGPRVRFLANRIPRSGGSVAIDLRGSGRNLDAIGARVELETTEGTLVRTLAAGSGFLSQSSKTLFFGIGDARPRHALVHWPDGESERFEGIAVDRRNRLVRGAGVAEVLPPREPRPELVPSATATPPASGRARTVLAARLDLPDVAWREEDGAREELRQLTGEGPVLVNLWASWCGPCIEELEELGAHEEDLRQRGLRVLALNVDELSLRAAASRRLRRLAWPFPSGYVLDETLDVVEALRMATLETHGRLALPTSLLVDAKHRLVAIYTGPVDPERLLADLELPEDPLQARAAATPFEGTWLAAPPSPPWLALASVLEELGHAEKASDYLSRLRLASEFAGAERSSQLVRGQLQLARALEEQGNTSEAEAAYRRVAEGAPDDAVAQFWLGRFLAGQKRWEEAARHLDEAVRRSPREPGGHEELARVLVELRRYEEAVRHLALARENGGEPARLEALAERLRRESPEQGLELELLNGG